MRKLLFSAVAFLLCAAGSAANPACASEGKQPPVATKLSKEQRQQNIDSFEMAWKTVGENHFDPTMGGVDWQAVRAELRPKIEQAENADEVRDVMRDMLKRLGHSHLSIIPASLYEDASRDNHEAIPGFDVRMVNGEAMVVRVSPGLPAAKAGVKPGWRIRKIDGEDVAPRLQRIGKAVSHPAKAPIAQAATVQDRLLGEEGKLLALTFLDGAGKETTLSVARAKPHGNRVKAGMLPAEHVHFESKLLEDGIVYVSLSSFSDPVRVMKAFGETIQKNVNAKGFILDLRGNPGGLVAMTQGMGGWFVKETGLKLGTMIGRTHKNPLYLNPRQATYEGPLAVLVDEFSMSSSEFLSAGLQDLKRARVFGRPTIGAALPSIIVRLPNGDRLQYVIADYISTGGKRLEGNGVQPDEVVTLNQQTLLQGSDPDVDAAMTWIGKQD